MFEGEVPKDGWPQLTENQIENLNETIEVKSVEVSTARDTSLAVNLFGELCARGKVPTVVKCDEVNDKRRILLKIPAHKGSAPMFSDSKITMDDLIAMIPDDKQNEWSIVDHSVQIPLLKLTLMDGLKRVLKGVDNSVTEYTSSFETCGHIAHFNLSKELMPYRRVIGQLCLKLNKHIKTVVVKIDKLNDEYSKFRVLPMELVAGEDKFTAKVKEAGLNVQISYDKVYWNSRLSHEREVQVKRLYEGGGASVLVVDLMAGVGLLPIMMKSRQSKLKSIDRLTIISNDLNPVACADQFQNCKLNSIAVANTEVVTDIKNMQKLDTDKFHITNLDARELMSAVIYNRELISEIIDSQNESLKIVFYMNLPAKAVEFLDVVRDLDWSKIHPGIRIHIYCYTFASGARNDEAEWKKSTSEKAINVLGYLPSSSEVRFIRNVAPNKQMCCFSFEIPDKCEAPPAKKRKLGTSTEEDHD